SSEEVVSAEEASVETAVSAKPDATPSLTTVVTKGVKASQARQLVTFQGKHFAPHMTARVFTPDGFLIAYGPSSIQKVTATTFTLATDLPAAGTYTVVTRNPSGRLSNEMTFVVGAAKATSAQ